jgi:hypothetical protein
MEISCQSTRSTNQLSADPVAFAADLNPCPVYLTPVIFYPYHSAAKVNTMRPEPFAFFLYPFTFNFLPISYQPACQRLPFSFNL